MADEYIVEQNGTVIEGPSAWRSDAIRAVVGLRGNAAPPPLPYTYEGMTLRAVSRETGEAFEGVVDEQWVIRAPSPPPPPVMFVSPRQARLALLDAGLLDQVESELAKPENRAAQISWEYATTIERDSDLVSTIGKSLGLSAEQIDSLFANASAL